MVSLHNHYKVDQTIEPGERIAQMVIAPFLQGIFNEVDELSDTLRGEGGFGSTGRINPVHTGIILRIPAAYLETSRSTPCMRGLSLTMITSCGAPSDPPHVCGDYPTRPEDVLLQIVDQPHTCGDYPKVITGMVRFSYSHPA